MSAMGDKWIREHPKWVAARKAAGYHPDGTPYKWKQKELDDAMRRAAAFEKQLEQREKEAAAARKLGTKIAGKMGGLVTKESLAAEGVITRNEVRGPLVTGPGAHWVRGKGWVVPKYRQPARTPKPTEPGVWRWENLYWVQTGHWDDSYLNIPSTKVPGWARMSEASRRAHSPRYRAYREAVEKANEGYNVWGWRLVSRKKPPPPPPLEYIRATLSVKSMPWHGQRGKHNAKYRNFIYVKFFDHPPTRAEHLEMKNEFRKFVGSKLLSQAYADESMDYYYSYSEQPARSMGEPYMEEEEPD